MPPSNGRHVEVLEFGTIGAEGTAHADVQVSERAFLDLKEFALNAADPARMREPVQVLALRSKGGGEVIEAQSYVGCITTRDGTMVEVLPKVAGAGNADPRGMLCRMLQTLGKVPYKNLGMTDLSSHRAPLYEIFIRMFVSEVEMLARSGFRSGYSTVDANGRAFKGKLLVGQDLRANPVNRAKAYTRRQSYTLDRPENRILKTAIEILVKRTAEPGLRRRVKRLLGILEHVGKPGDIDAEFARCTGERGTESYRRALGWAETFIRGRSFSSFAGSSHVEALLFPMNRLFEDYIAAKLQQGLSARRDAWPGWSLKRQDTGKRLFDGVNGGVSLRPDIVMHSGRRTVILDTKWKLASQMNPKPSNADLYQMYAYGKRYRASKVVLLYPLAEKGIAGPARKAWYEEDASGRIDVHAYFVDPSNLDQDGLDDLLRFCLAGADA